MRPARPALPFVLTALLLLAACERRPLLEPQLEPVPDGVPTGPLSTHAPQAGPLSTEPPLVLGPGSLAPQRLPGAAPGSPAAVPQAGRRTAEPAPRSLVGPSSTITPGLLWQNTVTGQRSIWHMNGAGWEGHYALLPQVDPSWQIVGVGDFSLDGKPDLLWQHLPTGQRSIWLMNGPVWQGQSVLLPTVDPSWQIVDAFGRLGVGAPPVNRLSAGGNHTCALSVDNEAYCWGNNNRGRLGDGTTIVRNVTTLVAGGHRFVTLAVSTVNTCASALRTTPIGRGGARSLSRAPLTTSLHTRCSPDPWVLSAGGAFRPIARHRLLPTPPSAG